MTDSTTKAGRIRPFPNDRALLLAALDLLERRRARAMRGESDDTKAPARGLLEAAVTFERRWRASSDALVLPALFRRLRLNRLEREIVTSLALSALGLCGEQQRLICDVDDLQAFAPRGARQRIRMLDATKEDARLVRAGVVEAEPGDLPWQAQVRLAPEIATSLVAGRTKPVALEPPARSQGELIERMRRLIEILWQRRGPPVGPGHALARPGGRRPVRTARLVETLDKQVLDTCAAHLEWPLSRLLLSFTDVRERLVIVMLIGHAAGYIPHEISVDGDDLARGVAGTRDESRVVLDMLGPAQRLRAEGVVVVAEDDDDDEPASCFAVSRTSFRLAPRHLEALGLPASRRTADADLRKPLVRLDQLALPASVEEVLRVAVGQIRGSGVLLDRWGLRQAIPYGRAVSLLFHGPPGVGKTAAAEALAHEAGRQIFMVSLAQVQHPHAGVTERTLARAFQRAKEAGAVLFLDECDALLYDRELGRAGWEVRQVNVLLQELERFEGACVLATNRQASLDAALDRRIAFKVEFPPPDEATRRRIWRCLLPSELPLAGDVDVDALADQPLTGGQIKNVVLNAARFAVLRGKDARVTTMDFERALRMEQPKPAGSARIGFGAGAMR